MNALNRYWVVISRRSHPGGDSELLTCASVHGGVEGYGVVASLGAAAVLGGKQRAEAAIIDV